MTFEEFEANVGNVPRALTFRHVHILYGLIRWLRPKTVVEVGSFQGFTSCWMARALQDNGEGHLFCIDDFSWNLADYKTLIGNLENCGVGKIVTVVPNKSQDFEWPACDLAFIDGDHSEVACCNDIRDAYCAGASCIVVHDTNLEGPRKAVDYELNKTMPSRSLLEVSFDAGLSILMAQPDDR